MTSSIEAPASATRNARGSRHLSPSGLLVLGLGSLVLLTGLVKPDPAAPDAVLLSGTLGVARSISWWWLAGWGMIGVVLVTLGLRQQTRKLVQLAMVAP